MTYKELIDYIDKIPRFSKKNGLNNIRVLLNKLGNPQEKLKIIHVAGTNGKGSVCAMLTSILFEQGYKVGTFISPHLSCYNERIVVDNIMISNNDFIKIAELVFTKINEMLDEGYDHPTYFEVLTACAFLYFYNNKVDIAVMEVGLGGKLDSTNIIKKPIVSVITSISLDHTKILGSTIEEITERKSGIIKQNCPIVLYYANKTVYNKVKEISNNRNADLFSINKLEIIDRIENDNNQKFSLNINNKHYNNLKLCLLGDYQVNNTATVLMVVDVLNHNGICVNEKSIYQGLVNTKWPGRMELIKGSYNILLDGAHNPEGINCLKNNLINNSSYNKITLIMGFLKDKSYKQMLELLISIPEVDNIIITQIESNRTLKLNDLEYLINRYNVKHYTARNATEALELAYKITDKKDLITCTGSLYLIGEIREILKGEELV